MTFTIFRRVTQPNVMCAVPSNEPVPGFVCAPDWEYVTTSMPDRPRPEGFNDGLARFSTELQGYYLFHELWQAEWQRPSEVAQNVLSLSLH
jgi:hypothetical protein